MIAVRDLTRASTTPRALEEYLSHNFLEIYDYFVYQAHALLDAAWREIDTYILLHRPVIMGLDVNVETNLGFQALLLEVAERFKMRAAFTFLYNHLRTNAPEFVGHRVHAASKYLVGEPSLSLITARYDQIYSDLHLAFETEEDQSDRVLATFVNCYATVVSDFGQFNGEGVARFKARIERSLVDDENSFLNHPLIFSVLDIAFDDFEVAAQAIEAALDVYLGRVGPKTEFWNEYITEDESEYRSQIADVSTDFQSIKDVASQRYWDIKNDNIFRSLNRGTSILTEEAQLFGYMYSYGENHYHKLLSAFPFLPDHFWSQPFAVIDWACGQGLATMALKDFIDDLNHLPVIRSVSLIEPSEVALRRASMHISRIDITNQVYTIHRDFDDLEADDLRHDHRVSKLHLFSNVLDMDSYSMVDLCALLASKFTGPNYFVCCSPFAYGLKLRRIDGFVGFFSSKRGFTEYARIDESRGRWLRDWTRCIRVFYAEL